MKVIDGLADDSQIAKVFAEHFRKICTNFNEDRNIGLRNSYQERRQDYVGDPLLDIYKIDAELVESLLFKMKRGKAAGLDDLMLEHVL